MQVCVLLVNLIVACIIQNFEVLQVGPASFPTLRIHVVHLLLDNMAAAATLLPAEYMQQPPGG